MYTKFKNISRATSSDILPLFASLHLLHNPLFTFDHSHKK